MIYVNTELILDNPYQTRQQLDMEHVVALADDIRARLDIRPETLGLLQVPAGRLVNLEGKPQNRELSELTGDISQYLKENKLLVQLAFGHNRMAAFKYIETNGAAGYPATHCYQVMPVDLVAWTDEDMAITAWSENEKRQDITPIEEAHYMHSMTTQFGWSQTDLAKRLGISRPAVANKLRLLDLPDNVQALIASGQLTERQAMAVLPAVTLPPAVWNNPSAVGTRNMLESAIKAGLSSDELRRRTDNMIVDASFSFDISMGFPLDHTIDGPEIRFTDCRVCPLLIQHKQQPRCGDIECMKRKSHAWMDIGLEEAAQSGGAPGLNVASTLEQQKDSGAWHPFVNGEEKLLESALAGKCPTLCIAPYTNTYQSRGKISPPGHPNYYYVCRCEQCPARHTPEQSQARAEAEAEKARREDTMGTLKGQAIAELTKALEDGKGWRAVLRLYSIYEDGQSAMQTLATRIVESSLFNWRMTTDPEYAAEATDQWLSSVIDNRQSDVPQLRSITRRWTRIMDFVNDLPNAKPDHTAVIDNIQNMRMLQDEAENFIRSSNGQLSSAYRHEIEHVLTHCKSTSTALQDIRNILYTVTPSDFQHIPNLLSTNMTTLCGAINDARKAAMAYALPLARLKYGEKHDLYTFLEGSYKLKDE